MNTRKRFAAGLTAAIMMAGGLALAAAAPASAHTPEVESTCATLSVTLTNYDGSRANKVTVSIDGDTVADESFGASFKAKYNFDTNYEAHSYTVTVDAPGTEFDRTFTGASVPCEAPPLKKDATAELTVTPPTCDVAATLVLGESKYGKWGTPSLTVGPGSYTVIATADKGHLYENGAANQVFSGVLAGALDPNEEPCYVAPVIPEQPEPVVTSVDKESVDCISDTVTTVTTTTTTGWVYIEESNSWVEAEPVVTTSSVTRDATEEECPTPVTPVTPPTPEVPTPATPVTPTTPEVPTPVTPVTPSTPAAASEKLASTGLDSGWLVPFAALLLAAGIALPFARRLRHQ